MMLSGCNSAPPSPALRVITLTCPAITRCTLPASQPETNGDLRAEVDVAGNAWAQCAARVDMIVDCQEQQHEKARITAPNAD
ncbi:Rz1-like lysis system protein LysC [Citrobacter sp. Cpo091]|uniref:Rz1-like lysis system protein LysC n=1 Tax=Citrobacter sp. Cpo091 TaxID=2985140 RepID=UPI00336BD675